MLHVLIIIIAVLDGKAAEPSGPQSTDTRSALKPQTVSISALGSAAVSAQKSVTSAQASVTSAPKSVTSSATDDNEKEEGEISSEEEETGEIKDNPTTGVVMTRSRQQTRSSSRSALASSPAGNTRQTRQRAALNRRYVLKPSDPHIL